MPVYKIKLVKTEELTIRAPNREAVEHAMKESPVWLGWDACEERENAGYSYTLGEETREEPDLVIVDEHIYFTNSPIEPIPDLDRN